MPSIRSGCQHQPTLDRSNRRKWLLVDRTAFFRCAITCRNREIAGVTLIIRTMGAMVCAVEQRHIDVLAWNALHRWQRRL